MRESLSWDAKQAYRLLLDFLIEHQRTPTYREYLKLIVNAQDSIEELVRFGLIETRGQRKASIRFTGVRLYIDFEDTPFGYEAEKVYSSVKSTAHLPAREDVSTIQKKVTLTIPDWHSGHSQRDDG